jgi:SAM-dependent methyltransferase
MNNTRLEYWNNMIESYDLDSLAADLNSSWDPNLKSYRNFHGINADILPYLSPTANLRVLDFGCGLGRNLRWLNGNFKLAIGYDLPAMIKKINTLNIGIETTDQWNKDLLSRVDIVYECTVFQHLDIELLVKHLTDIADKGLMLYSHTRTYNDTTRDFKNRQGGFNIAKLINILDIFDVVKCSTDIEKMMSIEDETHYDVLYKAK